MKNIGKLFLATAIVLIFNMQAQSQNSTAPVKQEDQQQNTANPANPAHGTFVDKNNNGVCDNFESRSVNGRGANFVDKNGDGICDNRAYVGKKSANTCRNGQGNRHRHGQGQGHGRGNCCRR